jgi:hypothetical protein
MSNKFQYSNANSQSGQQPESLNGNLPVVWDLSFGAGVGFGIC